MGMYGILRYEKYEKGLVRGIENHMERRAKQSNTNPDIKKAESKNNIEITGNREKTFNALIKERLEKVGITKYRKDAKILCEFMFTATHEFFEGMSSQDIRSYFQKCYEFAVKEVGADNIISAEIHLDEKTPHMHLCFVPITRDGRLCAKEFYGHPKKMSALQDKAYQEIFKPYGLLRGDKEKGAKHLSTMELKRETLQQEITSLILQKNKLQEDILELEKAKNNDELFKARQHLKSISSRLNKMMTTIESNPELLQQYKLVSQELKQREEEREL